MIQRVIRFLAIFAVAYWLLLQFHVDYFQLTIIFLLLATFPILLDTQNIPTATGRIWFEIVSTFLPIIAVLSIWWTESFPYLASSVIALLMMAWRDSLVGKKVTPTSFSPGRVFLVVAGIVFACFCIFVVALIQAYKHQYN